MSSSKMGRPHGTTREAGNPRNVRLSMKTTADRKARYQRAARLQGQTLTEWAQQVLDAEAARVITEAEG